MTAKKRHTHVGFYDQETGQGTSSVDNEHTHDLQWVMIVPPVLDPQTGQEIQPGEFDWRVVPAEDGHTHDLGEIEFQKPKKGKKDSHIHAEVISEFKETCSHEHDSFEKGYEAEEFYKGDGQWNEEAKQELLNSDRSALTINHIAPKIDEMSGHQRQSSQDIQYAPIGDGDQKTADMYNYLVKNLLENCDYDREKAKAFMDALKVGRGLFNVFVEYNDRLEPVIKVRKFNWRRAKFGPHEMEDLEDCEVAFKYNMYSQRTLEELFPDHADKIVSFFENDYEERKSQKHNRYTPDQYAQSDNKWILGNNEVLVDCIKKEYKIIERWRRTYRRRFIAIHEESEEVFDLSEWKKEEINQVKTIEGIDLIKKLQKKIQITIVAPNILISDEPEADLPVDDFHLVPVYCYKDDDDFWGKIEGAKDSQREINKRRSQAIDIGNSVVSHGWFYDNNTFPHNAGDQFKEAATGPRFFVEVNDINRLPVQVKGGAFPPEIVTLLDMADSDLNRQLNITPREPGANTSAAAILQAEKSKLVGLEFVFQNLTYAQKKIGRLLLAAIQKFYTPKRAWRVLNNMNDATDPSKQVQLGGESIQEFTLEDITKLLADTKISDYDVTVSETAYSPSIRTAVFLLLQDMMKAGVQVPPQMLIEYAPGMPQKVKTEMTNQLAQQAEQQTQAETAKADAEVEKTLAAKGIYTPSVKKKFGLSDNLPEQPTPPMEGGIVQQ